MYEDLIYKREEEFEGIKEWYWIKSDRGAWDGPKKDWERSHKEKYTKFLKKKDLVVCAGGNQGMYPRLFSDIFKVVYAFEPDYLNFHCLVNNCQKPSIIKINAALGASCTHVGVQQVDMHNTGMHKVIENGYIPQLTLDSFNLPELDFIQLDVEGLEIEVLRGAVNLIEKFKPVISCERGDDNIFKFLSPLGYKIGDKSVADTIYINN